MGNALILVGCLVAGFVLRRAGRVPDNGHQALNAVIIHLALPAVTLRTLHGMPFEAALLWPVLMPWALFAVGAVLFAWVGRRLGLDRGSIGALTLVAGLGNTSFVGLPMIEWLHGRDGLGLGLLIDQLGSYLALSTVGLLVAATYSSEGRPSTGALVRRIFGFPPFVALLLALALRPLAMPPAVDAALARLGDTLAPLALLSVGLQLRPGLVRERLLPLGLGLGFKLVACPALVLAVLCLQGAGAALPARVSLIEAAMPPMIGAGVLAAQARLDPPLVTALIGVGIPLGLLTAPLWFWCLGRWA